MKMIPLTNLIGITLKTPDIMPIINPKTRHIADKYKVFIAPFAKYGKVPKMKETIPTSPY